MSLTGSRREKLINFILTSFYFGFFMGFFYSSLLPWHGFSPHLISAASWSTIDSTSINLSTFAPIIIPHELKSKLRAFKEFFLRLILVIYLLHTNASRGKRKIFEPWNRKKKNIPINNFYCVPGKPRKTSKNFLHRAWRWKFLLMENDKFLRRRKGSY